jgi:hypothetical protein
VAAAIVVSTVILAGQNILAMSGIPTPTALKV